MLQAFQSGYAHLGIFSTNFVCLNNNIYVYMTY
jgi:hypothetical protein